MTDTLPTAVELAEACAWLAGSEEYVRRDVERCGYIDASLRYAAQAGVHVRVMIAAVRAICGPDQD